jgi:hypothetical protein
LLLLLLYMLLLATQYLELVRELVKEGCRHKCLLQIC